MVKITKTEMYNDIEFDVYSATEDFLYDFNELNQNLCMDAGNTYLENIINFEEIKKIFKKYETSKKRLIQSMNMKDDLKRHKKAVFLNTECGFIYDIALNVSEYL